MTSTPDTDVTDAPVAAALIQPLPAADDATAAARANAVAHHIKGLRNAISALRGMAEHELLAALLSEELSEIVTEARSIAARKSTNRRPARMAPTRVKSPAGVN